MVLISVYRLENRCSQRVSFVGWSRKFTNPMSLNDLDNLFWLIKKICLTKSFSLDEERRVLKSSNHECGYGCFLFSFMDCIFFFFFSLLPYCEVRTPVIVLDRSRGSWLKSRFPLIQYNPKVLVPSISKPIFVHGGLRLASEKDSLFSPPLVQLEAMVYRSRLPKETQSLHSTFVVRTTSRLPSRLPVIGWLKKSLVSLAFFWAVGFSFDLSGANRFSFPTP